MPLDFTLQPKPKTRPRSAASRKLFRKRVFDALWDRMIRVFGEATRARRVHKSKTIEGIVLIARIYEREAQRWEGFLAERGLRRPRRGPTSRSPFHGLAKYVLGIDRDTDGSASRLAAILDEWRAQRDRIAPEQIRDWIAAQGGLTRLYERAGERRQFYKIKPNTPERIARWASRTSGGDKKISATAIRNPPAVCHYQGDCLDRLQEITDHSVDLILTDLPYGTSGHPWDTPIDLSALWQHYRRIIRPYCPILLFGTQPYTSEIVMSAPKDWFKYEIVWEKDKSGSFVHAKNRPMRVHENIEVFAAGGTIIPASRSKRHMPYYPESFLAHTDDGRETRYPRSVLHYPIDKPALHPMGKPIALLRYLIALYSRTGEVVLDPCMGGGSTGIAAIELGRSFIGIEKEKLFFDRAKQRLMTCLELQRMASPVKARAAD